MVTTGLSTAQIAAAQTVATSGGMISTASVTAAGIEPQAAAAQARECEALAARLGLDVDVRAVPGGLTVRFSTISTARPRCTHPGRAGHASSWAANRASTAR